MARRRAAVINHAPGFSGMPCTGQLSSAARRLSCTTSSATSKLPIRRTIAPVSLAASSRKTVASASSVVARVRASVFHDRAHLDAHLTRPGLGDLERLAEVGHLQLGVAADDLFRLDVRAVRHHRFAIPETSRRGGVRALQLVAADDLARPPIRVEPFVDPLVGGRQLWILGALFGFHGADEQQDIFHVTSSCPNDERPTANSTVQEPVNSGSCLLKKDMMPIAASVLRAARAKFWDSTSSASSRRRSLPRWIASLIIAMAKVAARASLPASSSTAAWNSSGGTARSTQPTTSASFAERRVDSMM